MIRVVAQHSPTLFAILGLAEPGDCPATMTVDDHTYYRAESHDHFVLYKAALTGWGAGQHGRTFSPSQR